MPISRPILSENFFEEFQLDVQVIIIPLPSNKCIEGQYIDVKIVIAHPYPEAQVSEKSVIFSSKKSFTSKTVKDAPMHQTMDTEPDFQVYYFCSCGWCNNPHLPVYDFCSRVCECCGDCMCRICGLGGETIGCLCECICKTICEISACDCDDL